MVREGLPWRKKPQPTKGEEPLSMMSESERLQQEIDRALDLVIAQAEGDLLVEPPVLVENPRDQVARKQQVHLRQQQLLEQEERFERDRREQAKLAEAARARTLQSLDPSVARTQPAAPSTVILPPVLDNGILHMRDTLLVRRKGPSTSSHSSPSGHSPHGSSGSTTKSFSLSNPIKAKRKEMRFMLCDGGRLLLFYSKASKEKRNHAGLAGLSMTGTGLGNLLSLPLGKSPPKPTFGSPSSSGEKKKSTAVTDAGLIAVASIVQTDPPIERYSGVKARFRILTKEETLDVKAPSPQKAMKWIKGLSDAKQNLGKQSGSAQLTEDHPVTVDDIKKRRFLAKEISPLGMDKWRRLILRDGNLYCFDAENPKKLEWQMFLWEARIVEGGQRKQTMVIKLEAPFPEQRSVLLQGKDEESTVLLHTSLMKHMLFLQSLLSLYKLVPVWSVAPKGN